MNHVNQITRIDPVQIVGYDWRTRESDGEQFLSVKHRQVSRLPKGGMELTTIGVAMGAEMLPFIEKYIANEKEFEGGIVRVPCAPYQWTAPDGETRTLTHQLGYIQNEAEYQRFVNASFAGSFNGAIQMDTETSAEEVAVDTEDDGALV